MVAQDAKTGSQAPTQVGPGIFLESGDGSFEDYTIRCTGGGIGYAASILTCDA